MYIYIKDNQIYSDNVKNLISKNINIKFLRIMILIRIMCFQVHFPSLK